MKQFKLSAVAAAFAVAIPVALTGISIAGPARLAAQTSLPGYTGSMATSKLVHYRKRNVRRHRARPARRYRSRRSSVTIGIYLGRPTIRYNPYYRPYYRPYYPSHYGYGYPLMRYRNYGGQHRRGGIYLRGPDFLGSNR